MAKDQDPRKALLQKAQDKKDLEQEEESRARRIKIREERNARSRAEAEKKKTARAVKLASVWIGLIIIVFFSAVWFSPDFVHWLHELVN